MDETKQMTPEIVARLRETAERMHRNARVPIPSVIACDAAERALTESARLIEALHAALAELDKAALGMVQVWNRMGDKYGRNAPTVAEADAAKQAVHVAREAARRLVEAK